ncbi:hypothetical protein THALO_460103 [Tenacibaculum halocynthiae]
MKNKRFVILTIKQIKKEVKNCLVNKT